LGWLRQAGSVDGLEGSDFDLIHTRVVIGSEVTGIQPEQTPANNQVVHGVKLPEITLIETPIQLDTQLDKRGYSCKRKISNAKNVTL